MSPAGVRWGAAGRSRCGPTSWRLLHAYFEEQRPVFDVDSLVELGAEAGLDAEEARGCEDGTCAV
ncbi:hypothetical protein SAMN05661080_03541 [Modestobacter sp. DSM 44400]|uniref:hypothetical protein n=1 Tax=Modestobacter sp. DSM 44400 TaxID=1550230 RepID=UPI00089AAE14|nr:hypothetical protein [Modestobacter sp. DSM 44400]SDY46093.1 hypothetical protein SAMN05661080_03541 [Modestobacter sp. DSM 44400]